MTLTNQEKPTILVTGATGFIGRHLVDFLLANRYRVSVYSRRQFSERAYPGLQAEDWFTGDMADAGALTQACLTADAVVHLANLAHAGLSDRVSHYDFNVDSTRVVCEACLAAKTRTLVYISSALALSPERSAYAQSKRRAEQVLVETVRDAAAKSGGALNARILRPANVYGPGMKGNIAGLIRAITARRMPPLPALTNGFAMVSVHDVCLAIQCVIENAAASDSPYLITDGELYTPNRVETAIYTALQRSQPRWRSPRMVFYAGALLAEALNRLRPGKGSLGLRTYQNLVSDRPLQSRDLETGIGFRPTRTFEDDLPAILTGEYPVRDQRPG